MLATRQPATAARPAGIAAATFYVPEIESLRGVAIMLVVLYHLDGLMGGGQTVLIGTRISPVAAFMHAGHTGVSLFFVLSAFLLSQPFLREAAGAPPVRRRAYFIRRALRIVPLYWSTVIVASVLCAARFADVLHGLPYLAFIDPAPGFASPLWPYSAVWWSLGTEVQFYLLLPLLPYALRSRCGRRCGAVAALVYAAAYWTMVQHRLELSSTIAQAWLTHSLFGRASLFACGVAAAWCSERYGARIGMWCRRHAWVGRGGADCALLAALLGQGWLLGRVTAVGYARAESAWHPWHTLEGALWTACLMLLILTPVRLKPLLSNRVWQLIGTLSYSLYIVHYPLLDLSVNALQHSRFGPLLAWNPRVATVALMLVMACLTVSAATYWAIERPFLVRKARVRG